MRTTIIAVALALVTGIFIGLSVSTGGPLVGFLRSGDGAAKAQGGTADSDGRFVAVTGAVGSGTSVLWLVDTEKKRVCVYKSENGKNIVWVASRNVAYDFKVEGYHDESSLSAEELRRRWEQHSTPVDRTKKDKGAVTEPVKKPGDEKEDR